MTTFAIATGIVLGIALARHLVVVHARWRTRQLVMKRLAEIQQARMADDEQARGRRDMYRQLNALEQVR